MRHRGLPHRGLGGQVYHCAACDETRYSYHSCRNRHCPQCQHAAAQRWLREQQALLLPAPYFLLTFTLPAELRSVAQQHPRLIYNLLFRASAAAAEELARDPRFIGGQLGLIGILQTWARQPDLSSAHSLRGPRGRLGPDDSGLAPRPPRLSAACQGAFRAFPSQVSRGLTPTRAVPPHPGRRLAATGSALPARRQWRPGAQSLAPYVFQVAISNKRIVRLENDQVNSSTPMRVRTNATPVPWTHSTSSAGSCSMSCPKGSARCGTTAASAPVNAPPAGRAPLVRPDDRARRSRRTARGGCATARRDALPQVRSGLVPGSTLQPTNRSPPSPTDH